MVTRPRQENYKQKLLSEGWTRHDIYLPPGIADRLKELQERHRDTSLGDAIARLTLATDQPKLKDSDKADELWTESGHNYKKARALLLEYLRKKHPGFKANEDHAGFREYDSIGQSLRNRRDNTLAMQI